MKALKNLSSTALAATLLSGAMLHAEVIPGLYNSGVDDNHQLLGPGEIDPHYTLISSADPVHAGPDVFTLNPGFPVGPWLEEGPNSRWIAPRPDDSTSAAPGTYIYRTTFDLTGFDPGTAWLDGLWSMDNSGANIRINGVDTGITADGFDAFKTFTIQSGFVAGLNTLDFLIGNAGSTPNPTGFRVELYGEANAIDPDTPLSITQQPSSQTVRETGAASFKVVAHGSAPVTYQWYLGSTPVDGGTSAALTIPNVTADHAGIYTVQIGNFVNSVTSEPVTLTVHPAFEAVVGRFAVVGIDGIVGRSYRLESSGALPDNWLEVSTAVLSTAGQEVVDPGSSGTDRQFYRAVLLP